MHYIYWSACKCYTCRTIHACPHLLDIILYIPHYHGNCRLRNLLSVESLCAYVSMDRTYAFQINTKLFTPCRACMCTYIVSCSISTSNICDKNKVRQRLPLISPSVCNIKVSTLCCSCHYILCSVCNHPITKREAVGLTNCNWLTLLHATLPNQYCSRQFFPGLNF